MHFCKVSKEDHRYFIDEGLKPEITDLFTDAQLS